MGEIYQLNQDNLSKTSTPSKGFSKISSSTAVFVHSYQSSDASPHLLALGSYCACWTRANRSLSLQWWRVGFPSCLASVVLRIEMYGSTSRSVERTGNAGSLIKFKKSIGFHTSYQWHQKLYLQRLIGSNPMRMGWKLPTASQLQNFHFIFHYFHDFLYYCSLSLQIT